MQAWRDTNETGSLRLLNKILDCSAQARPLLHESTSWKRGLSENLVGPAFRKAVTIEHQLYDGGSTNLAARAIIA